MNLIKKYLVWTGLLQISVKDLDKLTPEITKLARYSEERSVLLELTNKVSQLADSQYTEIITPLIWCRYKSVSLSTINAIEKLSKVSNYPLSSELQHNIKIRKHHFIKQEKQEEEIKRAIKNSVESFKFPQLDYEYVMSLPNPIDG